MLTDAAALRCAMLNMKNQLAGFAEDQVYSPWSILKIEVNGLALANLFRVARCRSSRVQL